MSSSVSDRLHRSRVTGPIGDPRSIRVAEHFRAAPWGSLSGDEAALGQIRAWETIPKPGVFPVGKAKQALVPITMTNWGRERIRAGRLA